LSLKIEKEFLKTMKNIRILKNLKDSMINLFI